MVQQVQFPPEALRPIEPTRQGTAAGTPPKVEGPSFQQVLQEKLGGVRFSAHAQKRLDARRIRLSEAELARLSQGVNRADAKGARESLILMDQVAFVVSIPNRTVVTAVDSPSTRGAVFTQIDSAVIV